MEISSHNYHHDQRHHYSRRYHHPNRHLYPHRDDDNDDKCTQLAPVLTLSSKLSHCISVVRMLVDSSTLILSSRLVLGLFQTEIRRETKLQQFGNASR
jgi:hypothetical protein